MRNKYQEIQELVEMLKSDDVGKRYYACGELGDSSTITEEAIKALQDIVENDRDVFVAEEAYKALEAAKKATIIHQPVATPENVEKISTTSSQGAIGNIQKWEHRWEFVYLAEGEYVLLVGEEELTGRDVWNYLASLGRDGWELVSVAPQIGDTNPQKGSSSAAIASMMDFAIAGPRVTTLTQHKTGTTGYFFWYKRPA